MTKDRYYLITGVVGFALGLIVGLVLGLSTSANATDSNQVEFWCDDGMKIEDPATPFVVPDPPQGATWTLLVLKAGTENHTIPDPSPGVGYSHPNGKELSHAILCYERSTSSTTTSSTTTTSLASTTTTTEGTTSTTSSSVPPTTTSTTPSVSSSTTTAPPSSSTTAPPTTPTTETPVGGVATGGGAMALAQHLGADDPTPGGVSPWVWIGVGAFWLALSALAWAFVAGGTRKQTPTR